MTVGYRAILRLHDSDDAVAIADEQVRSWFRTKVGGSGTLSTPDWDGPGHFQLGPDAFLDVTKVAYEADRSSRQTIRFLERNRAGSWEVTVTSLALPQAREHRQTIVVEAGLRGVSQEEAILKVAPPRVVANLLDRLEIHDGATRLTSTPRHIRRDGVEEVVAAIRDEDRTGSVVVAVAPGKGLDRAWSNIVTTLTKQSVGDSAVFVITDDAYVSFMGLIPDSHAVKRGRIRTFIPAVDFGSRADGIRHRVLGPATLTRSIYKEKVTGTLPWLHASGIRRRLLEAELPGDVARGLSIIGREESQRERALRVERAVAPSRGNALFDLDWDAVELEAPPERRSARLRKPAHSQAVPLPTRRRDQPELDAMVDPRVSEDPESSGEIIATRAMTRLLGKWLTKDGTKLELAAFEELDEKLTAATAGVVVAEQMLDEAATARAELEEELKLLRARNEDLDIIAGIEQQSGLELQRENTILRRRLIEANHAEATFVEAESETWAPPEDITELLSRLTAGPQQHPAFERVIFTGTDSKALEVQRRDPVGRYATAFWDFVHVLHDYAERRSNGSFTGNVHSYLTSDVHDGHRCSMQRHAGTESESVAKRWGQERVFPVPAEVAIDGAAMMLAHFKPTHENTFAPRMHYYDDTENTGKVYVGYIGAHLTNTKTSNS